MSNLLVVIIIAVVAVGLFVVGMSLTLIFKGHHIDSEIGDNKHMKARGIKCASQQIREEERAIDGSLPPIGGECTTCHDNNCGTCH